MSGSRTEMTAASQLSCSPAGLVSVSTDGVPAGDRFEWWGRLMRDEVMAVSMTSERPARFHAGVDSIEGGPSTKVSALYLSASSAVRTHAHIRRHDPEDYYLFAVRGGQIGLEQDRRTSWLRVGDLGLYSTSWPLEAEFRGGRGARVEMIRLPRTLLPLPFDTVDRLLAERLSSRTASGALLDRYLSGMLQHAQECGPAELPRLGSVAADLAVTFLAGLLDIARTVPSENRKQALLARIDAFIERNLSSADLRPADIAEHHHISVRMLHALFQERPETVSAAIRRRRLDHCRTDLTDPRLRHRTIGEIALGWGFRHPADFSRAFRAAFGMPPGEFRHTALTSAGGASAALNDK
ncbi:AraC-like ligand-binding domain-containing protein [Streptomyces fungicidicus]|uniref:AraC-like ligand-binding domain-containing protein n=1 Tax=Streptomyces fungicidicus TaxID=68203 RepID=UPI0013CE7388|nr:helix-turn-helix domain-containing protein [Streptomyces fungicidicus]